MTDELIKRVANAINKPLANMTGGCFKPDNGRSQRGECADADCYCARVCRHCATAALSVSLEADGWKELEHTPEEFAKLYDMDRILVAIPYEKKATAPGKTFWQIDTISFDDETGEINEDTGWRLEDYTHYRPLPTPPSLAEKE